MITLFTQIQEAQDCNEWRKARTKGEGEKNVLPPPSSQKREGKTPPATPRLLGCALMSWYNPLCLCMCISHPHIPAQPRLDPNDGDFFQSQAWYPTEKSPAVGILPRNQTLQHSSLSGLSVVNLGIPRNPRATQPPPMRRDGSRGVCFKAFVLIYLFVFMFM